MATAADGGPPGVGRRAFLSGGLTGTAAGIVAASAAGVFRGADRDGGGAPAGQVSGRNVRWRLASSFPQSLDTIFGAAEVLAERVAAMTGGRFAIEVFQAGELVPPLQVMDAVEKGAAEVGQSGGYYYTGKAKALAFDTCVPFGLTPRQQDAWLHQAGGAELLADVYAEFGIVAFPSGSTGAQMGGWFRQPVERAADLRGLRMRIPGLGGKVMDKLGVSVQAIAGGDIYPALERGAIDATEWVGPYDDEKLGFWQVAKNYYYPGFWEPGPNLSFMVNRTAWDALPVEYREIFRAASREAATAMQIRYDTKNPPALRRLLAPERGVVLRRFSDDILRAAREASEQLLADEAAADPVYARILEHWRAFRRDAFHWFGTCELSYAQFAFGE